MGESPVERLISACGELERTANEILDALAEDPRLPPRWVDREIEDLISRVESASADARRLETRTRGALEVRRG